MAAPNREAHVAVIKECYERAGIDPNDLDYIEAQGMGNQVGDIAEWEAFNRALEQLNEARGQTPVTGGCRVSSVKPLIGHMECMSALGALFKIIGGLINNRLYGIYGLEDVNPYLAVEGRPCRLLRHSEPWSPKARPRLAALHSYGSGGNNAHLLIEEYVAARRASTPARWSRRHAISLTSGAESDSGSGTRPLSASRISCPVTARARPATKPRREHSRGLW
jgi:acyl transferase domain-containing protein